MIENFSEGYYRTLLNVQEYEDGPVIERNFYDYIDDYLYAGTDAPIMMRVGFEPGRHFDVHAESAVPRDTLALPPNMIDSRGEKNVFVLKADHTPNVGSYNG